MSISLHSPGGADRPEMLALIFVPRVYCMRHPMFCGQACCAISGDGVYEGLDWLSQAMMKKKTTASPTAH